MNLDRYPTLRTFLRLLRYFGNQHLLVSAILITVVLAGLEITTSYLIKQLLDSALEQDFKALQWLMFLMFSMTAVMMVSRYLRNSLAGRYTERGIKQLRNGMAEHLLFLPNEEQEKRHSGEIISRMTNDMNQIKEFTTQSLLEVIYNPLAAVGAFIYLLTLNWELTLITTFIVPFIFRLSSLVSKPIAKYAAELQERLALVSRETQEAVNGIEVVRAYGLESVLSEKFSHVVDKSVNSAVKLSALRSTLLGISLFVSITPFFICFGFGGYFVVKGYMTAGALIAFITLLNPLTFPLSQLPTLMGEVKAQMVSANRIFEVLDWPAERTIGGKYELVSGEPVIAFENVNFSYPEGEPVLHGVSFTIEAGERVALVGPSGSGKSTIFNLLLGYFEHYTGEIRIFNQSLRNWNLQEVRNQISLVAQDTYLFPGTIEENIGYGKKDAEMAEKVRAAQSAYAHDFISDLKDGYRSDVGEFGDNLSGGQKQRICLARAILKNAPIFLLDEATSSLDTQSEYQVQKALEYIMAKGVTSLVISHRISTIQKADRILVLEEGKIVESGNHEELLALGGIYYSMCTRQCSKEVVSLEKEAAG